MLRLGIIGCGRVTSMFHLRAIEQIEDIAVTALSDIDQQRVTDTQKSCGAEKRYTEPEALFNDSDIDAVAINTPPRLHEKLTIKAVENGKHVLCEKPLAEKAEGCMRIKAHQDGFIVLPAHNYRFSPSITMMEEYVEKGKLGEVTNIEVRFENNLRFYRSETDFRTKEEYGIIQDVLPHVVSVIHPLVGHIDTVDSVTGLCSHYEVCDNLEAGLVAGGVPVKTKMSWTTLRPRFSLAVECEKGSMETDLVLNPYKLRVITEGRSQVIGESGLGWYLDLVRFRHPSFKNQYIHFKDAIDGITSPKISIEDEINILETMIKASDKMEMV